jgi:hypothetical protein
VLQTCPVQIDRRTLLLGVVAAGLAACSSTTDAAEQVPGATVSLGGDGAAKPNPPAASVPTSVTMVGDSITALSRDTLQAVLTQIGFKTITINAEPSRRMEVGSKKPMPGLDVVKFIAASAPPEMWVIALGTNDAGLYATDGDYQGLIGDMLGAIPDSTPLVWVSTYRHDQIKGCEQFNGLLRTSLAARRNATMGEWYQQCTKSKESILTHDGVHPNADGILVFADTARAAIAERLS